MEVAKADWRFCRVWILIESRLHCGVVYTQRRSGARWKHDRERTSAKLTQTPMLHTERMSVAEATPFICDAEEGAGVYHSVKEYASALGV